MLSQHQLQEILGYDPVNGLFLWLKPPVNHPDLLGQMAGSVYSNGYRYIQIKDKAYRCGRLAWFYITGEWPEAYIDHIDKCKSNDSFANLRKASNSENQANRGAPSNNTSGTKGVRRDRDKWRAQIMVNGKSKNLGRYKTREEAMSAYAKAAEQAWGLFANQMT